MQDGTKLSPQKKMIFAALVYTIVPLTGMSTDIYLPSLPAMGLYFGVNKGIVQFTVTAFVVAMGLSQLIAGPISDALGRKKLLLVAVATQFISVVGILWVSSIYWVMGLRFIQGMGAAFMTVPARAIVSDIFQGPALKKQFNYLTISFALGPIVAPFIGAYLQYYFGWQANFVFILIYVSFLILALIFIYQETIACTRPFSLHHLWQNYHFILSHPFFLVSTLFLGMALGYSALFNVAGPFLVQTQLHYSVVVYGHLALFMGLAWFLGNMISRLFFHMDPTIKSQLALWGAFLTGVVMIAITQMGIFNLYALAIPTFLMIFLSGIIFPVYVAECLMMFPKLAGSANACLFGLVWFIFGGFTFIASLLKSHSLTPLAITYISTTVLSLGLYYGFIKKHH